MACKNNELPGPDNVRFEFIKHLPHNWVLNITSLFNKIFVSNTIPLSWSEIMLHKKGPLNCFSKLFTLFIYLSYGCTYYKIHESVYHGQRLVQFYKQ